MREFKRYKDGEFMKVKDHFSITAEIILAMDPGDPPCDCAEVGVYKDDMWSYDCQCGNYEDTCDVAAWCRVKNLQRRLQQEYYDEKKPLVQEGQSSHLER